MRDGYTTVREAKMPPPLGGAMFAVLVQARGVDGSARPLYDLYALKDTGLATKLNRAASGAAVAPACSRARLNTALAITAAADGSVGAAHYGTDGAIVLFDCAETLCKSA